MGFRGRWHPQSAPGRPHKKGRNFSTLPSGRPDPASQLQNWTHMASLTKCVPGFPGIRGSVGKNTYYTLFDLWAQECLCSLKLLQKWKVQTICDRSCVPCFSQGCILRKDMTDQSHKYVMAIFWRAHFHYLCMVSFRNWSSRPEERH